MPGEKEQPNEPEELEARDDGAPEPPEPDPRGNRYSEPDEMPDQVMPPPHPV